MGRFIDHSGETHGKLTLLRRGEDYISPSGHKSTRYYCSCSCGKYTESNPKLILWSAIQKGMSLSCGCTHHEKRAADHSGETYGRLTLLKRADDKISSSGNNVIMYYCSCSCGKYTEDNPKLVRLYSVIYGNTKSCGCINKERLYKNSKKYNKFDISGEYGIGWTLKGEQFYFDLEDYNKIKDYCWYMTKNGYIMSRETRSESGIDGEKIHLHRLVMDLPDSRFDIDHIHEDTRYDNRKSNLRIATRNQNSMNKGLQANNTSGVTGVSYMKKDNVWRAYITMNGKQISLGTYSAKEDAIAARKCAEDKYFGEYSYDNSQVIIS